MRLSREIKKLLNLSPLEVKVLETLDTHGTLSMQELSDKTRKARTTVYWPLMQLYKRGLVEYDLVGKRKRWRIQPNAFTDLAPQQKKDVVVVEGIEAMQKLYNNVLHLGKNERVVILEGTKAIHSIKQKGGTEFMTRWHTRAHEKKIIIESILGEKTYKEIALQGIDASVLQSLARWETWIGYLVPDQWVTTDAALVVFRGGAILADWDKEQALYIQAPELLVLLRSFCVLCQTFGKKVDIVRHVREAAVR